jgi:hypothetical protein
MPRLIVWHCDSCDRESRSESTGWLVVKEFRHDRPKFYSFCSWECLSKWLSNKRVPDRISVTQT